MIVLNPEEILHMDIKTISILLWIAAAVIFVLYLLRRRSRKTKQFR